MYPIVRGSHLGLPIRCKCELSGIARSSYYRMAYPVVGDSPEYMQVLSEIHIICIGKNRYGYRRVTVELHRRGFKINHKCVLRLMRKDNLLCLRKRKWICTTNSSHQYRVYPNLTKDLVLTHLDQLWVADITYVRLAREFVYLAVILDAFSRRVIAWALSHHIDAALSISALRIALETRSVTDLIHHSDRGVQYAADEYTEILTTNHITISMSRRGSPYDNAKAESFMKTLKYEEVLLNEYETLEDAKENIGHFIDNVYNSDRLHSSLGYRPPIEFEADFLNSLNQEYSTLTALSSVSV